jgi:hypothetical protein
MINWAKTEAVQASASLVIVGIIIFVLSTMCAFQVGEFKEVFGTTSMPKIYQDAGAGADNLYTGAMRYIENVAALALSNVASMRYDLASYELRTSYTTFECSGDCLLSLSSVSVSPFSGNSMALAISNNMMGIATVSYLSAIFQYFTLVYIYGGLFMAFLPLAFLSRYEGLILLPISSVIVVVIMGLRKKQYSEMEADSNQREKKYATARILQINNISIIGTTL